MLYHEPRYSTSISKSLAPSSHLIPTEGFRTGKETRRKESRERQGRIAYLIAGRLSPRIIVFATALNRPIAKRAGNRRRRYGIY